ncbi:MAG: cupin domain-containing protein [Formivibrio sp.]|nr:cupin domain-containing protein [Formivibrio sp.]
MIEKTNLFAALPAVGSDAETFTDLLRSDKVRIERIVSTGQASPPGFWYDQPQGEWVAVLSGAARLRFAEPDRIVELNAGDFLDIPPHVRHRVEWTDPAQPTVWLAVHYCN